MKPNQKNSNENQPANKAGRLGKKLEKVVVWLVVWTLSLTFPVWIYGMLLAIDKGEFRPVAAMFVLITASGLCAWFKIVSPLIRRFQSEKTQISEN